LFSNETRRVIDKKNKKGSKMKTKSCFKNVVFPLLTAVLAFALSGCIKQKILVRVKPDGSGTILVSAMYQKKIVEMVDKQMAVQREQFAKQGMNSEAMDKALKDPFFNEESFKQQAKMFGSDIEYLKAKKVKTSDGRGFIAVYAFKNIEDVKLDIAKLASPASKFGPQTPPEDAVSFKFTKGEVAKLTVTIPKMERASDDDSDDSKGPTPMTEEERAQLAGQGAMFGLTGKEVTKEEVLKKMYSDMSFSIGLQVDGTLVKSNATYQDPKKKGRCTLFSIDFGTVLEDDKSCGRMARNKNPNFLSAILVKEKIQGIKLEEKPEITVEFKKK
jgi:hypothetical protein